MAKTKLAELDDTGNVLLVHVTNAPKQAIEASGDDRVLVPWDESAPDDEAFTRRWDGEKFVSATQDYMKAQRQIRAKALSELERELAAQHAREAAQ